MANTKPKSQQITHTPAVTGGVTRDLNTTLADFGLDVIGCGADPTGETSSTDAFSRAAKNAQANNPQELQVPDVPLCEWAVVRIPSGIYTLNTLVDTGNREIVWDAAVDAVIVNPQNLNGRLWREGSKTTDYHSGINDSSVSFSITSNRNADELAQVSGFTNPNQLSKGNGRDSVSVYVGNKLPPATYGASSVTGYTALSVNLSTPLSSDQLKLLRKGMIVQTRHATKYAGMLDSFAADGSSITVKDGWFLVDGSSTGSPVTPTGTDGVDINIFRKSWALNANVFLDSNSYGNALNTVEFGLSNTKGEPTSRGGQVESNGVYSVNLANDYYGDAAFLQGAKWTYAYLARSGVTHAFYYDGYSGGYTAEPLSSLIYGKNGNNIPFFQVKADGGIELGLRGSGTATPVAFDFHSGATDSDYDARIISTGGTGSVLGASLQIAAASIILEASTNVDVAAVLRPKVDTTTGLGQAARRWSTVYAVNGTIQTSDEREKQQIRELTEAEMRVAKTLKTLLRAFKYNDAVNAKGSNARIHFGVIAQDVVTAFESEGLDASAYGILCFDSWEDEPEVLDNDGNVISSAVKAGNRFGIRYDELLAFIIVAL